MNTAPVTPFAGWIVLAGFSVAWIFLGWFWGRGRDSHEERMLAGRNIGRALGTATAMATWVTSNTTMAAPQLAYQLGFWGMVGYSLGAVGLVLFAPLSERIQHLLPNAFTSGDFVRLRYGRRAWSVFMLISLFYGLIWLVSMGMAGGVLLNALTGIDYRIGMVVIVVACTGYTLLGGLYAVVGTDFIQSILILVGLIVAAVAALSIVGVHDIHAAVASKRPVLLSALAPASLMFLFNNLLFGVGEIFHSNVWWSRAFAFRKGTAFGAYLMAGIFWMPVPIVAGFIALAAPAMGLNVPALDMVGPLVVAKLLGGPGAIMILCIVFASLASSLDSLLAATTDLLVQDVYRASIRRDATPKQLVKAGHTITIGLSALAIAVCWTRPTTLAEMIQFTGPFVASTIWPIAAGLYFRSASRYAATAGMLLGTGCGIAAYFVVGFFAAALVSATVSMLCVVVGMATSRARFDWRDLDEGALQEPADAR